jgi:hypothetical protein
VVASCECIAGYTGPNGGECSECDTGKYKEEICPAECSDRTVDKYLTSRAPKRAAPAWTAPLGSTRQEGPLAVHVHGLSGVNATACAPSPAGEVGNSLKIFRSSLGAEHLAAPRSTSQCVCVYYCRTYYKAVCGGGGGQ